MTWIKKESTGKEVSMNFKAATGGEGLTREVLFPLAEILTPEHAATQAVTVKQFHTFLQPETLEGNSTVNLTIDEQLTPGAQLHLMLTADTSNRTVTLGTGFAAPATIVVKLSDTAYMSFVFDGTEFLPLVYVPAIG